MNDIAASLSASIDTQTFVLGGAVFVLVEAVKLFLPALAAEKRGEHALQIATLVLGLAAGLIWLRDSGSVVGEDPILTGLRRGFAVGAVAFGGFHAWRLGPRALWRLVASRWAARAEGQPTRLVELDPRKRPKRKAKGAAKSAAPAPKPRSSGSGPNLTGGGL